MSRSGLTGQRLRSVIVAILFVASSLSSALANQGTPIPDGDTRVYVGHVARLVAKIPATWRLDRTGDYDYSGHGGFISSNAYTFSGLASASIEEVCDITARHVAFEGRGVVRHTTWRDVPACVVRAVDERPDDPVALVFGHPEPGFGGQTDWIVVTVDAEHFEDVTASISFDLSGVTAAMYLDAALDILESHSLWRDAVDWNALRDQAHVRLGSTADTAEFRLAHAALRIVVQELWDAGADGHTGFIRASQAQGFYALFDATSYPPPEGAELGDGIGYVLVPGFGGDAETSARFASDAHTVIASQAPAVTCGWIVDLRENTGGAIPPMIGGLSPLLAPGAAVWFRDVGGDVVHLTLSERGEVEYDEVAVPWLADVTAASDPGLASQPVAVLVGPRTASAGEATAIAFAGRDRTAFFGEPTAGMATSPILAPLLDGSVLLITSSWMGGPQGAIYPDGIAPDVEIEAGGIVDPLTDDPAVQAASEWLLQQPGCDVGATPAA